MDAVKIVKAARLTLRPLHLNDAEALYAVYHDAETMRFWDTVPHATVSDTRAMIERMVDGRSCWWTIYLGESDIGIGNVGYLGNVGAPGLGYILHRAYWRQGYMTEAVQAALDYGFTELQLDRVELWIDANNVPSQQVAAKVGFKRRGRFRQKYSHQPQSHEKLVYGLTRREWRPDVFSGSWSPAYLPPYSLQPILAVRDVKAAAEYYCDQLGFSVDWLYGDPPTHGAVSCSEWTAEGAHIQFTQAQAVASSGPSVDLYLFMGPDIDAWYQRYSAQGVQIERELATYPWGMREFSVRDCNGYLLRFGTPG